MSEPSTVTTDQPDTTLRPGHVLRARSDVPGLAFGTVGGLTTYYRLRCLALEAAVLAVQSRLDRTERRLQNVITRYENVLQGRDCREGFVSPH